MLPQHPVKAARPTINRAFHSMERPAIQSKKRRNELPPPPYPHIHRKGRKSKAKNRHNEPNFQRETFSSVDPPATTHAKVAS